MKAWIEANRIETTSFDIVVEGKTPGDDPTEAANILRPWSRAGATWWIETMWDANDLKLVLRRIS